MRQKAISRKLIGLTAVFALLTLISAAFLPNVALATELQKSGDGAKFSGPLFGSRSLSALKNRIFSFGVGDIRRADIASAEAAPSFYKLLFSYQIVPATAAPLWLLNRALLL